MKKVIITTGGTGGHIYPALSVGEKIKNMGSEVVFVGSKTRMEKELVEKEGIRFIGIDIYPLKNIKKIFSNILSIFQSIKIIHTEKPDIIFGFGNYISIPMLLVGALYRKEIYLQEQNADIGLANKLFYKLAKKCFLAFDTTFEEMPLKYQPKFLTTGNPLREDIYKLDRKEEREKLKINENEKVLLITGGSLGSKSINQATLKKFKEIHKEKNIRIYWATGEKNFLEISEEISEMQIKMTDIIKPYFDNMINLMTVSDLIICRAGALTISEIIQLEVPSILIPYNSIKVGQYKNAEILVTQGGSILYDDSKAELALERALSLIKNDVELTEMREKVRNLKKDNATNKIVENLDLRRK